MQRAGDPYGAKGAITLLAHTFATTIQSRTNKTLRRRFRISRVVHSRENNVSAVLVCTSHECTEQREKNPRKDTRNLTAILFRIRGSHPLFLIRKKGTSRCRTYSIDTRRYCSSWKVAFSRGDAYQTSFNEDVRWGRGKHSMPWFLVGQGTPSTSKSNFACYVSRHI